MNVFLHKAADNEVIYVTNNIPLNISFARVLIGMDFLFAIRKLIILVLAILCIVVAVIVDDDEDDDNND